VDVDGSVHDENGVAWTLSLASGDRIADGTGPVDGKLGSFDARTLAGPGEEIILRAEDAAGNVNEVKVSVVIDNLAPQVVVTGPAPGSAATGSLLVEAMIVDDHPGVWRLHLAPNPDPIAAGHGAVAGGLAEVDLSDVPEGLATLELIAEDLAGNESR